MPQLVAVISNYQKKKDHLKKNLLNIKNIDDNVCFKWWLIRY